LQLYDISGRLVKTLVNESKQAGNYTLTFNAKTLSTGIYFVRLTFERNRDIINKTVKLVLY
ncbi:MAG: T9SS type A sorting domain-containing protein, partial [candidate division WOR-3 bacterium]|nr:T9SS type A sorting domain-containing protein [candidate division WOR-3 bacterium]